MKSLPEPANAASLDEAVESLVSCWKHAIAIADDAGFAESARRTGVDRRELVEAEWVQCEGGSDALRARAERVARRRLARASPVCQLVLELAEENPSWGRKRLAKRMEQLGYPISPSAIRRVLVRRGAWEGTRRDPCRTKAPTRQASAAPPKNGGECSCAQSGQEA